MPASQGEVNLHCCSQNLIEGRLYQCVNDAVVFLDDSSAEVVHWHGGASALFDYGALDVREFSSFEVQLHWIHCIINKHICTYAVLKQYLFLSNFVRIFVRYLQGMSH